MATGDGKHTFGIIGGGRSGHALLRFLLRTNVADIVFLVDPSPSAPAVRVALSEKIPVFRKLDEVFRRPLPDFIFEISAGADDGERLKQHLRGKPTRIINQATSRMMVSLVEDNRTQLQNEMGGAVRTVKGELVAALGTSGRLVGDINGMMVSMQTLALNAAIEAAKVGRAGKGFMVVAENMAKSVESVRRLTLEIDEVNNMLLAASGRMEGILEGLR